MIKEICISVFLVSLTFCSHSQKETKNELKIKVTQIAKDFVGPVAMEQPKNNTNRLFICEQTGKIKIIKDGKVLEKPFLDVSSKLDGVNKVYSEKGLLGIAFHPKYKSNGRFFIYYSTPEQDKDFDHKSVL